LHYYNTQKIRPLNDNTKANYALSLSDTHEAYLAFASYIPLQMHLVRAMQLLPRRNRLEMKGMLQACGNIVWARLGQRDR
jgi:hypothetical protein